jgi:glutamyl-tRNA synthetase
LTDTSEIAALARHLALQNASRFGKTSPGVVSGHLLARRPELVRSIKEFMPLIASICEEVNSLPKNEIQRELDQLGEAPPVAIQRAAPSELELVPNLGLPGYALRFAPNPDGPLTLGNARPALLCDFFAKKYKGRFVLRFEDTSPSVKPPLLEAYGWVFEDLNWLGVKVDEVYYQSDRLELYYSKAKELIQTGGAYVCLCDRERFRVHVKRKEPCPHRGQTPAKNLELLDDMLSGKLKAGEAVVRVKTDLSHPNPAIRDWPALRIDDAPHPRVGSKYRVWPLYNWSAAVDDHEMGITHIVRAKEHLTNEARQKYVFKHFGWKVPTTVTIGRVKLEGSVLSKSKIMVGLKEGSYLGMDDPRLGTLKSLRRRGILPEVIRETILDLGAKPVEATIKWDNLSSANRAMVDGTTKRFFFVANPVSLVVRGAPAMERVTLPNHPANKELGERKMALSPSQGEMHLLVSSEDLSTTSSGDSIRLMGLFNVKLGSRTGNQATADFESMSAGSAPDRGTKTIQWVPEASAVPTALLMPDATWLKGFGESNLCMEKEGELVQLMRVGFVKLEEVQTGRISAVFSHR